MIKINNIEYDVIKDDYSIIDIEELEKKITDYYDGFTYIVGDIAYNKLRLKGFYDENDKIITLSTCANDNTYRVVLHAVKINWVYVLNEKIQCYQEVWPLEHEIGNGDKFFGYKKFKKRQRS